MENQKIVGVLVGGVLIGAALGAGITMNMKKRAGGSSNAAATCSIDGGVSTGALFELDGKSYSKDDLPADTREQMFQFENQSYEGAVNVSKETALRISLFKEKNGGKDADLKNMPKLQDLLGAGTIPESEMKAFYEANKSRMPPGMTYEQVKPQLEQFMQSQKVGNTAREKIAELESSGKFKVLLRAPAAAEVDLQVDGYPAKGASSPSVTVVEVSDYLCPHCRTVKPEVEEAMKEFGSKVKFVQVNFALNQEGLSGALTRGGVCAKQQSDDAFWKYHDKAFEIPTEAAKAISPDEAKEFNAHASKAAADAGLDVAKFDECLTSEATKKAVAETVSTFSSFGVSGTPTFFVNNRKVNVGGPGALKKALQDALASK